MEPIASEIYETVKEKMEESGEASYDAFEELVDETIDEFKDSGVITDDDNEEFIKEQVLEMWSVYEETLDENLNE